jgi:hypothetical protein
MKLVRFHPSALAGNLIELLQPKSMQALDPSILEPEIQPFIPLLFSLHTIGLIIRLLLHGHLAPHALFPPVQQHEILPEHNKSNNAQRTNADQDFITLVIIRAIVSPVNLGTDERANLHDHVVRRGRDSTLLQIKAVLGNPCANDY